MRPTLAAGVHRLADPKITLASAASLLTGAAAAARDGPLAWGWLAVCVAGIFALEVAKNASGELVDGTKVDSPVSLRQAILKYSDQFVRTMTEKLMIYGVGRGLEYYDMPAIRGIVRKSATQNYRFSSIVVGIVSSAPFQMRVK